ncbi:DUF3540 domain-containing protein [Shewanella surugensis]|uniref:DUF3540 domain-containing protein n=1 Tax=Shewanella surugensis TaxID=212020 RepID=A0ABT0LFN6_9GAMM|nr:DUF3540 domain-containing protein [Shewanella surugensis]MCL1126470.1 DUF3540 domain-containing protein [Shewanella surugensis]
MNAIPFVKDNLSHFEMETGTVVSLSKDTFADTGGMTVLVAGKPFNVKVAAGCLLQPSEGDMCLVAIDGQAEGWLLSVLVQRDPTQAHITHQGDLSFNVSGKLQLTGNDVATQAMNNIAFQADAITSSSQTMAVQSHDVSLVANKTHVISKLMNVVADKVDHVVEMWLSRLGERFQIVRDHDEQQTGSSRHLVDGELQVHAENIVSTADEQMVLDAEKIHLG